MNAVITYPYAQGLLDVFVQEDKQFGSRASYTVVENGDVIRIDVSASDATAFRTMLNAVSKVLSIWEGVSEL